MSDLVRVELARFFGRRAMRVSGLLVVLGIVLAGSLTFAFSHRDVEGATRTARIHAQQEYLACLSENAAKDCEPYDSTQVDVDPRFHLAALDDVFRGTSVASVMLGLALGAAFVGAEWHHRTMTSLLTWEPRRIRVAAAKLAVAGAAVFVSVLAMESLLGGALVPAAVFRGTTSGVDASWLAGTVGVALKGATLAAMGSVLGGAIALVARNSAVAIGIAFGWLAVGENMIRNLKPGLIRWLIGDNAVAFIAPSLDAPRSATGGALVVAAYVVAAALVGTRIFRRRDLA